VCFERRCPTSSNVVGLLCLRCRLSLGITAQQNLANEIETVCVREKLCQPAGDDALLMPLLCQLLKLQPSQDGWQSETEHESKAAVVAGLRRIGRTVSALQGLQNELQVLRLRVPMVTEYALREKEEANQLQVEMLHLRRMLKVCGCLIDSWTPCLNCVSYPASGKVAMVYVRS
jgi:hypothetical protein